MSIQVLKSIMMSAYLTMVSIYEPFMVAERSEAWTVFARWDAGIVGSNPT
jgi:hypothetical protein